MDDDWKRVRAVFDAALRRRAQDRERYLEEVCRDHPQLLAEVKSLFSSLDHCEEFMEKPAVAAVADVVQSQPRLQSGALLAHYEVIRQINRGGMGEVYLASDQKLDRTVAIKVLNQSFSSDVSNLQRFVREAKAASALNHPNILVIHEIGEADGMRYIVSEFIEGITLRERLLNRILAMSEVLDVSIQVANALAAAHQANLIHRDIKPENVMIRPDGVVKVLDFGLAKLIERKTQSIPGLVSSTVIQNQTATGVILGTVNYMSPEQAKGEPTDQRTDIFSLGEMLYELIVGTTPFAGNSSIETLANLINAEPPPLTRFPAKVPAQLQRIITKMLRKEKDARYQTMKDVCADLKDLRERLAFDEKVKRAQPSGGKDVTHALPTATRDRIPVAATRLSFNDQIKRRRVVLIALAILLVGALSFCFWFFRNRQTNAKSIHSIAVMPFNNVSNNPDVEYLSDGLSESLTNSLSPVPGLTVISQTSSFKYKGKEVDPQEVARNLKVEAIVTGRITRLSDGYLISVELVDTQNRRQIWGKQYNGYSSDLLKLIAETSREITQELRVRLTQAEERQLSKMSSLNPEAYDLYLKGQATWAKGGTDNRKQAAEYYNQAITIDQGYALAYVALANAYSELITNNELKQEQFAPKAEAAAHKAVELDDNLAEAHLTLAEISMNKWEWNIAESEIKRTLELNPNLARAHRVYYKYLLIHGRLGDAVAESNRAQELNPLETSAKQHRIETLWLYRQWDEALELQKQVLETDPSNPDLHLQVGWLNVHLGRNQAAIQSYLEAIRLGEKSGDAQTMLAQAYAFAGERNKTLQILNRFESGKEYASPFTLSILYLALGDRAKAFSALEAAYQQRDQQLIWLKVAWDFDPIRTDPRYENLVRRIGL